MFFDQIYNYHRTSMVAEIEYRGSRITLPEKVKKWLNEGWPLIRENKGRKKSRKNSGFLLFKVQAWVKLTICSGFDFFGTAGSKSGWRIFKLLFSFGSLISHRFWHIGPFDSSLSDIQLMLNRIRI